MTRSAAVAAMTFLLALPLFAAPECSPGFSVPVTEVFDIAVDETDVYFTRGGTIWRVSRNGGTPVPFAHRNDLVFMMLAVDERGVYVQARNSERVDSVLAIAKDGQTAVALLQGFTASAIVPDGEWLYLLNPGTFAKGASKGDGAAVRVKVDGSAWERLATGLRMPMGLVLDGEDLYFSERGTDSSDTSGGVRRMSKEGGRAKRVGKLPMAMAMAQDASSLYVATLGRGHEGSIHAVSKNDGSTRELVRGLRYELVLPLEVFDGWLYFGTQVEGQKARLEAIRLADGTRRTLAEFEGGSPFIAVDGCGVYYSTQAGIERAGP